MSWRKRLVCYSRFPSGMKRSAVMKQQVPSTRSWRGQRAKLSRISAYVAHFYNGHRAKQSAKDYAAFDAQKQGTQPFQGVTFEADKLDISTSHVG